MLRRQRSRFIASALAASAVLAAGCGSSSSSSGGNGGATSDPKAVLASIKVPAANVGPQKVDVKMSVTVKGKPTSPQVAAFTSKPITLSLTGSSEGKKADLTYTVNAGPISGFTGGLRVIDDKSWLEIGGTWYELPTNTSGQATSGASVDPQKLLEAFGKPDQYLKDITSAGSEKIGDVDSDHIKGNLDLAAFLEASVKAAATVQASSSAISDEQLAKAKVAIQQVVKKSTAEVWVGKSDKFIHKLSVDLTGEVTGDTQKQSGVDGFDANIAIESTPTTSITVEVPAGAKPASELQQGLGGLLGGLSGSLGSTSP